MKHMAAIVAAATAMAFSVAAEAATYINYGPVGADGGFTITFGNTGITTSSFSDTFNFSMPTGRADFVITTTMSGGSQDIDWTSVTFNGEAFDSGSVGWNEFQFLNGVDVTQGSGQQLVLSGLGGGNASYSGVITFMPKGGPGPIPEPGAWALMIAGFGATGVILRRTRRREALA